MFKWRNRQWWRGAALPLSALLTFICLCAQAAAQGRYTGVGRTATPAEIAAWDIDVRADFKGLPAGSGSVANGERIWEAKCTSCHGSFGESNAYFPPIIGGTRPDDIERGRVAALTKPGEQRTTMMKLSQISTLWDYINRAMPWNAPKTLTADEVYALSAYILNQGGIVADNFVLSERNIADVQKRLPNRNGMTREHGLWETKGRPDVHATACMNDCGAEPRIVSQLPDHARGSHGDLSAQNRLIGPVRGVNSSGGAAATAGSVAVVTPAARVPAQVLAEKSGCLSCHATTQRGIGPSLNEIAARYRTDSGAESKLVAKVNAGGQGVGGSVPMPPFTHMKEQDLRTLVRWILKTE